MKTATILGIGAVGLLLFGFAKKATSATRLNFYFNRIDSISFQGLTPVINFTLLVQNTSTDNFTINAIAGNIYCNNILIGNVAMFQPFSIAPNGQNLLSLQSNLMPLGIVTDLIKAVQFGQFSQKINFEGSANVDGYQIPFNLDYQIGKVETVKQ